MKRKVLVKVLTVVCCTALIFSMIAGCTSTKTPEQTTQSQTTQSQTTQGQTTQQQTTKAEEREVIDISIWQASISLDNVDGIKEDLIKKWVEEKFGVRLTLMTGDFEKIKLLISTGQGADIMSYPLYFGNAAQEFMKKILTENMVYDIGDMVSTNPGKYPTLEKISSEKEFKFINYQYTGYAEKFLAVWAGDNSKYCQGAPVYNMPILNELNLKIPETLDEFINVLRTIKRDKPDIIPYNFANGKGWLPGELNHVFFTTHGTRATGYYKNSEGIWVDAAIDPRNKDVWALIQQLYKEGLIDPETFTKEPYYLLTNDFANDKVAVINAYLPHPHTGMYTWIFDEYKKVHPDATVEDVVIQPAPLIGPGGSTKTYGNPFSVLTAAIIPKTSKNPERALELINWFWSNEGQITKFYGIEGVHHTKDASGNIASWDEEKWNKDMEVWNLGGYHGMFFAMTYASGAMVQYDTYGWFEGHRQQIFVQNERSLKTPQALYSYDIIKKWNQESYVEEPIMTKFVNLSSDINQIRMKLEEISKKHFTKFLFGEVSLDAGWDEFVKEYKDAGSEKYLEAYAKAVDSGQLVLDTIK